MIRIGMLICSNLAFIARSNSEKNSIIRVMEEYSDSPKNPLCNLKLPNPPTPHSRLFNRKLLDDCCHFSLISTVCLSMRFPGKSTRSYNIL